AAPRVNTPKSHRFRMVSPLGTSIWPLQSSCNRVRGGDWPRDHLFEVLRFRLLERRQSRTGNPPCQCKGEQLGAGSDVYPRFTSMLKAWRKRPSSRTDS